jgi:chemotaxis protein CheZ
MTSAHRPFRIEVALEADKPAGVEIPGHGPCGHGAILEEIARLREELRPTTIVTLDLVSAYRREIAEVMQLKGELEMMQRIISDTRREVSSLAAKRSAQVGIDQLSGELGMVVQQTESAANTILSSAERIESEMSAIIERLADPADAEAHVTVVMIEVSKLYEACNFQDLTGQRLNRVMETLLAVETRVAKMMSIWGGLTAIDHLLAVEEGERRAEEEALGDQSLAHGPAIAGDVGHVNQLEIDALFG